MITSIIPDNVAEIALAKLLALTPFVGYIGDIDANSSASDVLGKSAIIFVASSLFTQTYQGMTRKASGRYIDHEVINGPPVTEYTGRSLKDMEIEIVLHSQMCIDPLSAYERLEKACDSGNPQLVFLEGKNYGRFTIRSLEGETTHWAYGRPAVMQINMAIKEYVSSLPTAADQKKREDELRRAETGKGGPDRLPGTGGKVSGLDLKVAESYSGFSKPL